MQVEQRRWSPGGGWDATGPGKADLVLVFGGRHPLEAGEGLAELAKAYPGAPFVGCSTSGEIRDTQVTDDHVVATAVRFEADTRVQLASASIDEPAQSQVVGRALGKELAAKGLVHTMVLSDGQSVNGSDLVRGLESSLPKSTPITGGLAGDADRFEKTVVLAGGQPEEGRVVVMGWYGSKLRTGFGSLGGWDAFGPARKVTKSEGNVLFELDGRPALGLYKQYLGEHAQQLPASGLLFPLSLSAEAGSSDRVRTILHVDEAEQSLTFAGDVPTGSRVRLMKANFERLVDGAIGAARASRSVLQGAQAELAVLISCVGRKLVLGQRTETELEGVREVLGASPALCGFYSYGEICPAAPDASCELHNQTMTITTLSETGS